MNRFLLSFDAIATSNFSLQANAFVAQNRHIDQWSFLFPGCFFLKSNSKLQDLRNSFMEFFPNNRFMLVRIYNDDNESVDGRLSKEIWDWFLADNRVDLNALAPPKMGE